MVGGPGLQMDKGTMLRLLSLLGERLHARGVQAELYVLGGSAMALAYSERRVTTDIGALFEPVETVREEARALAEDEGIQDNWLNNAVAGTLQGVAPDNAPRNLLDLPGLSVRVASPEYVLALKAMISTRNVESDLEDAAILCNLLDIKDEQQIEHVVRKYFGNSPLGVQELRFERIIDWAERLRGANRPALPVAIPPLRGDGSCGHWMKIAKRHCRLPQGHLGQHR